ncbi:uncharacterized protein TrAtP1_005306 [Trichoderma atroviride]|uniref:uncharacterized protein n=1 Tax=Hypocrea atroviridis TaxID=63577 RepID=UPI00331FCB94|nr:hypothetical protein TrAtP1_005306 [Trichoderma atroviride]
MQQCRASFLMEHVQVIMLPGSSFLYSLRQGITDPQIAHTSSTSSNLGDAVSRSCSWPPIISLVCLPLLRLLLGEWLSKLNGLLEPMVSQHQLRHPARASLFHTSIQPYSLYRLPLDPIRRPPPRCVPGSPFGSPSPAQAMPVDVNA